MNTSAVARPKLQSAIEAIRSVYKIPPQSFSVGDKHNGSKENDGSRTIIGFAIREGLSNDQTLAMFGEAYDEVLANPAGTDHDNIRALVKYGLEGVQFNGGGICLKPELQLINDAWEDRTKFSPNNAPADLLVAVSTVLEWLDSGKARVAMKLGDDWFTNQTIKKAVLLSFRLVGNDMIGCASSPIQHYDKVALKCADWGDLMFQDAKIRLVPGSVVRYGAYLAPGVIQMPSFINIGAYVGEDTMVDGDGTTVGSCAQIGKNVHLSMGVGIGGVLEPIQANPVIIEDGVFLAAGVQIVEGVVVRERAVISMGVCIGRNTPIIDRVNDKEYRGEVPANAVVMQGIHPEKGIICPVILKYRDGNTDAATALNDLLR